MNNKLNKAIMNRSRLRNRFLRNKTEENKKAYNRQRNYVVSLLKKSKHEYYNNLNTKDIIDNKKFWTTVKPLFSDKISSNNKIILIENGNILSEQRDVAEVLNNAFSNILKDLNIPQYNDPTINLEGIDNPILAAIEKYKNHPSIQAILSKGPFKNFSFSKVNLDCILKHIKNINIQKASQESEIPNKIVKDNHDIFGPFIHKSLNQVIECSKFPKALKMANITPIFKKTERTDKNNYRPVSILPNLSKIYERCLYDQILDFFNDIFSKYQCGFRKNYSTQYALLLMIEKWRESVDSGNVFGALLTDLSKAFDCLPHDLILAKLHAYGFDEMSLKLMHDYLSGRQQRTKIENTYSSRKDINHGVPQGSIWGPLLFNIFLHDMFFIMENIDIASYADDTTPYASACSVEELIRILEEISANLFNWFSTNQMKANESKCHLILSTNNKTQMNVNNTNLESSNLENLLGVKIDNKLNFESHLNNLCKKASSKIHALARISPYLTENKRKILMGSFFTAQFGYCPLVWMNCSREVNNKINRLHERCLRLVYSDKQSSFKELLTKDKSVTIHHRNIQKLATEMFKALNTSENHILNDIFPKKIPVRYNLRHHKQFSTRTFKTVHYGTDSIAFLAQKIWDIVPEEIKASTSVEGFRSKIKNWKPEDCPCRLCKIYIPKLGFL